MIETNQILEGRQEDITPMLPDACVDLVATDPPFNIDLGYVDYRDNREYGDYVAWTNQWVGEARRLLKPFGSIYVCIGDEFAAEMKIALRGAGFHFRNWIIWAYGFGQNQRKKFSRCHTHILYATKHPANFTFNAADILVPSKRQLVYGDKRAKSGGKTPDDIWTVYGKNNPNAHDLRAYPDELAIWEDSRLCGSFDERIKGMDGSSHPCQIPLSIFDRMIRASSNHNEVVLDMFSGTATCSVAAVSAGRRFLAFENSPYYAELGRKRLGIE